MKVILLIAASFAVPFSGCKIGTGWNEDYFPLAEGNRWVWVGGVVPSQGDTIAWEIEDKVVGPTGESAWKVSQKRFWLEKKRTFKDSINLQRKSNLLLIYKNLADPTADTVLNYPLRDGREWAVRQVRGVLRTAHISGMENVETPYGNFANALRIDCEDRRIPNDSLVMKATDWYVENVGRVMTRVEVRGQVWEMRLTSMELH